MNEILKEFVDVLRDPVNPEKGRDYSHVYYKLRDDADENRYCAGGVLCDILVKRFPDLYYWKFVNAKGVKSDYWRFGVNCPVGQENIESSGAIPDYVFEMHGITNQLLGFRSTSEITQILDEEGVVFPCWHYMHIYSLSDNGVPWSMIADIVEILGA